MCLSNELPSPERARETKYLADEFARSSDTVSGSLVTRGNGYRRGELCERLGPVEDGREQKGGANKMEAGNECQADKHV